jgi:RNA polymerase sigma factor (sigma-70 family)
VRHHARSSREDIEDGILHAVELLEKKRPCFENIAQAYVWLFRDLEHYLQHSSRAATHLEALNAASGFSKEDSSIHAFETHDALDHAFEPLSDEDKELLYLNHVSGFTLEEIAAMRGVSLASMKARHRRAMKRIRRK